MRTESRTESAVLVQESARSHSAVAAHPDPEVLAAFAQETLREEESSQVLSHLARCSECRAVLRGSSALRPEAVQLPPAPAPRSAARPKRSPLRWLLGMAALAAAVTLLVHPRWSLPDASIFPWNWHSPSSSAESPAASQTPVATPGPAAVSPEASIPAPSSSGPSSRSALSAATVSAAAAKARAPGSLGASVLTPSSVADAAQSHPRPRMNLTNPTSQTARAKPLSDAAPAARTGSGAGTGSEPGAPAAEPGAPVQPSHPADDSPTPDAASGHGKDAQSPADPPQ